MGGTNKPLKQLLSKADLVSLVELINASLYCACEDDFTKLLQRLRELVFHDFAICGLAKIGKRGDFDSYKTLNINYPKEWIELYIAKKYNLCDPVFVSNFTKLGLQKWAETYKLNRPPRKFLSDAHDFGLVNGYTFGLRSRSESTHTLSTLISLSGKSLEQHERTSIILENVMPHLHQALTRVANPQQQNEKHASTPSISAREKEVLFLLKDGKNSWAISTMLNISERTVHFHVGNIMQKLGAESRLHAVAIAAGLKLIDLD